MDTAEDLKYRKNALEEYENNFMQLRSEVIQLLKEHGIDEDSHNMPDTIFDAWGSIRDRAIFFERVRKSRRLSKQEREDGVILIPRDTISHLSFNPTYCKKDVIALVNEPLLRRILELCYRMRLFRHHYVDIAKALYFAEKQFLGLRDSGFSWEEYFDFLHERRLQTTRIELQKHKNLLEATKYKKFGEWEGDRWNWSGYMNRLALIVLFYTRENELQISPYALSRIAPRWFLIKGKPLNDESFQTALSQANTGQYTGRSPNDQEWEFAGYVFSHFL